MQRECPDCGRAFSTAAVFDLHRPGGRCLLPPAVSLVVAPLVRLTWTLPWLREVTDPKQAEDD
jgi:hypothetical protein